MSYFEEALSDFVHDVASGGAIRHLVDLGYSLDQICESLSYPEKPERVRRVANRYMLESGMLLYELPPEATKWTVPVNEKHISTAIYRLVAEKGEERCYISCPFGMWGDDGMLQALESLSAREKDYIRGIPWEKRMAYHRLTSRMREIGAKLLGAGTVDLEIFVI